MSERTALDIALDLDAAACSSFAKLEAAEALRRQHAEIERLSAINSALTAKSNALVDENAWLIEKIGQLTDEKFRRFNNEECWIYQRSGENHLGTLTCPVVISPDALLSMKGEISTLTADRDAAIAAADALRAALLNIHALRPIGLSASVYALTVENIARSAIAKAAEEKA